VRIMRQLDNPSARMALQLVGGVRELFVVSLVMSLVVSLAKWAMVWHARRRSAERQFEGVVFVAVVSTVVWIAWASMNASSV